MKDGGGTTDRSNTESKVMPLGDLRQTDSISVYTESSNYRFSILDPINRRGMLTGGALGDELREAILIGAMSEDDGRYNRGELKTGSRAVFLVTTNNCLNRMITSVVTDIAHINRAVDDNCAA